MGLHGYDTYGSQGIRFQWRDEQGEAEGTLSWSSVEQEIGTLILTGEYKSRDRQNNEDFTERAADYTALLVLAEADASTLTKRQKAQRNISALKILKQIENEKTSCNSR